jgi:glycosyltransferase involved in cell wall biosynthesis
MSELVPAYSAMNAGLFTTHHNKFWSGESFGLSLIEAMSCECGVIAMNKGATTELIGNCSHISELLDTRDVDAWGFALNKYVSTPKDELEKRAAQLRKRVVENYDASLTYTRLVDTIMTV